MASGTRRLLLLVALSHWGGASGAVLGGLIGSGGDGAGDHAELLTELKNLFSEAQSEGWLSEKESDLLTAEPGWLATALRSSFLGHGTALRRGAAAGDPNSVSDLPKVFEAEQAKVKKDHEDAQKALAKSIDVGDTCSTSTKSLGLRAKHEAGVEKHKKCRVEQAAERDKMKECTKSLDKLRNSREAACNAAELIEKPSEKLCSAAPGVDDYAAWLKANMEKFAKKYDNFMEKKAKCQNASALVAKTSCALMQQTVHKKEEECDGVLDELEKTTCTWAAAKREACATYDSCYEKEQKKFQEQLKKAKEDEAARKKTWETTARLKCVATAGGDIDKMNACINKKWTTDHLDLKVPTFPGQKSCPDPKIEPGKPDYKAAVYSPLPKGLKVRDPNTCPKAAR